MSTRARLPKDSEPTEAKGKRSRPAEPVESDSDDQPTRTSLSGAGALWSWHGHNRLHEYHPPVARLSLTSSRRLVTARDSVSSSKLAPHRASTCSTTPTSSSWRTAPLPKPPSISRG